MEVILVGIGFMIGYVMTALLFRVFRVGTLRVDTSDPDDRPYMFLELSKNVQAVMRKKYIVLKVSTKNFISQKQQTLLWKLIFSKGVM